MKCVTIDCFSRSPSPVFCGLRDTFDRPTAHEQALLLGLPPHEHAILLGLLPHEQALLNLLDLLPHEQALLNWLDFLSHEQALLIDM